MKIGFDSKRLFCNFTGLGNYSRTLVQNLHRYYPDERYYLYTTGIRNTPETSLFLNNHSFEVRTPGTPLRALWRSWSVKRQLAADDLSLYHGLSHEIPFGLKKNGIRSVVTIHDLIFRIHPETYSPIDRRIYDFKTGYACRHADRIIAISESTKKDIIRYYGISPEKIDVIYQACNPIYYEAESQEARHSALREFNLPAEFLLFVGSVEPRKNLMNLVKSYRYLKESLKIPLVVVGKGGRYKFEVMQRVKEEGLEHLVTWIGGLTDVRQVRDLYRNSQALIYPSLYEGFGLPVAEAMLSRTPVITSNRSSLPEAGGPGSLYVDPENPEEIAAAIEKVVTDAAFRQHMIETGYQYAHEAFAPEKVTRQIMECYKQTQ